MDALGLQTLRRGTLRKFGRIDEVPTLRTLSTGTVTLRATLWTLVFARTLLATREFLRDWFELTPATQNLESVEFLILFATSDDRKYFDAVNVDFGLNFKDAANTQVAAQNLLANDALR
jgi:hypothetical protein